jgi:hypothetical protein
MGYTSIGSKRVYGKKFSYGSMGPTNITKKLYEQHKDKLTETEYTSTWLEAKYDEDFPDVSFKYTELSKLDYDSLSKIAQAIGIKYHRGRSKPNRAELMALRRSVSRKLDEDAE